jgi:hypothetical protein
MRSSRLNRNALVIVAGWFVFWSLVAVVAGLGGCGAQVRHVSQPLPLPERPLLPAISADELSCLAPGTYRRLSQRERLRREYAETLEAIVGATQEQR